MSQNVRKSLETIFETLLWRSRLITIIAVIFSLLSSLALFVTGSHIVYKAALSAILTVETGVNYNKLLIHIISAIDLYLIGIVLLIFSFGIYELFISKIDPAHSEKNNELLEVKTLDDLKNRLLKVIVIALIVFFFKTILSAQFQTPLQMLYLALAILAISASSFLIHKTDK